MFLVVFATLILSVVGLFAQVMSVQEEKAYAAQTALADTMEAWHFAVVQQAIKTPPTNIASTGGCTLAPGTSGSQSISSCTGTQITSTVLPAGYNSTYDFSSLAFRATPYSGAAATNYVVTYVPDATVYGYTQAQLLDQLSRTASQDLAYGIVQTSGTLTARLDGAYMNYTIPTSVALGSVAIVSAAQ